MKHYVKIAVGVSKGYIQYSETIKRVIQDGLLILLTGLIGGVGQGGGSSPIIWMALLMIMLRAYKMTQKGAEMQDSVTGEKITFWLTSYVDDNTIVRFFKQEESIQTMLSVMSKCLDEWLKILQITGGDLSLGKCKITIMKWKQKGWRGNMVMETKDQAPGTVNITSIKTHSKEERLERLNPWEAERILGLRIPLTGSMGTELKFRKEQLDEFGKSMYKAPLNQQEAHVAYQSRYKPKAKYPLPVTIFTTTELMEMQKKCIFQMLPKMGFNRHTPRAVIYGPKKMGGREILDLRVEQPTLHVEATLGHMRRGDKLGKTLYLTMRALQIEVGISEPFYNKDPNVYTYITPNTRWGYFWNMIYEHKLEVEIYNFWTPKSKFNDDKNIMEVAVTDKLFLRKDRYKLASINRCRLYLQVFYLSDLVGENNKVKVGYLNGESSRKNMGMQIPAITKPTKTEWEDW